MKYVIEKDIYLGCWVVWERLSKNAELDIYHGRTKRVCKEWLKIGI
jgi:hypothetical protein